MVLSLLLLLLVFLVTVQSDEISEEEYNRLKVQLAHTVYGELTEADIRNMMEKTLQQRRLWIKEDNPPAATVLKEFPRLLDTPGLVCICVYDWNLFMFVILKILCIIILRSFYSTSWVVYYEVTCRFSSCIPLYSSLDSSHACTSQLVICCFWHLHFSYLLCCYFSLPRNFTGAMQMRVKTVRHMLKAFLCLRLWNIANQTTSVLTFWLWLKTVTQVNCFQCFGYSFLLVCKNFVR